MPSVAATAEIEVIVPEPALAIGAGRRRLSPAERQVPPSSSPSRRGPVSTDVSPLQPAPQPVRTSLRQHVPMTGDIRRTIRGRIYNGSCDVAVATGHDPHGTVVKAARKLTPWRRLKTDPPGWVRGGRCGGEPVGRAGAALAARDQSSGVGVASGEVAVFEAVAVAFEGEDLGVVNEPVDHRGGGDVVAEDLAPGAEGLVAGDDQRGAFVAAGDEHEHQVRGLRVERDVADLVDDQQRDPLQPVELCVEAAVALGVGEQRDPFGRGAERDAVAGQAGADPERDREVGLAGAGRAEQDDVLLAGEEVELAEMQDGVALEAGLEGEVELLQRLARGEPRGLDPGLAAVAVAAVGLGLQQRGGELLVAPLLRAGAVGELGQRPGGGRRFELAKQMRELGRRAAHAISAS